MPIDRERIAHYTLIRNIGAGAMGEVYEAEDEHLKRRVAVKVIAPAASSQSDMRGRFLREAHAAAAFTHPNIAHIYDVGTDDGIDYIAMEYIDGETLSARLARGAMTIDDIVDIALQLVDALAAAHDRGVVHRDIKPSNLMITSRGQVKVLDFGLARMEVAPAGHTDDTLDQSPSTNPGTILGTTSYMSPEQALGEEAVPASDVFSAGVVMYEMIAGRVPFAGKTAADTLHRLTASEPEPLARFNYDLPVELERIVRRCLEKAPSRRYRSAGELLVDLKSLARDRSSGVRAPRWAATRRPQARRIAAMTLLVLAVLALTVWGILVRRRTTAGPPPPRPLRAIAVLPFSITGASDEEFVADGITDSLINSLAETGIRVMARSTVFVFKHSHLTPQQIGRQLNVDAVVTADIQPHAGNLKVIAELVSAEDGARLWGEPYERNAADLIGLEDDLAAGISHALQLRRPAHEQAPPVARRSDAHEHYLRGQYQMNSRNLAAAADDFRRAILADPSYAPPYAALADTFTLTPRYLGVPAAALASRAHDAARKALQLDPSLPEAHVSMASVFDTCDWNWQAAEQEYRKAIALRPGDVLAHQWYALLLTRLGRAAEARTEMQRALALDPLSPALNLSAAYSAFYAGRYDEAESLCAKTIGFVPSHALAHLLMAAILMQQRRYDQASKELDKGGGSAEAVALRGVLHARQGNAAAAGETMAQLLRSGAEYELAVVAAALGRNDAAIDALERASVQRRPYASYAKVDPLLGPLHGDKRFTALLQRFGLS
jgi:TolB-like protein/Tfp pilus assembly protein PilF/tRNA A-37 threonylcarbamoyl transferase component Bud32